MPTFMVPFSRTEAGVIYFEADDLEEAKWEIEKVRSHGFSVSELMNNEVKIKHGDEEFLEVEEV